MKRLLYIISFIASTAPAWAQVKITGRIIDLQNKPIADVIVKLMSDGKTLAYTSSNAQGQYTLSLKETPQKQVQLQFVHIAFEKDEVQLPAMRDDDKIDMRNTVLIPKTVNLKEVMVKPDPLRQYGDTLSHNLASFLGKGDVTLEDGLKRLPGVDVAKSGAISYMGRPISQFNIEGLDLLGGKYNLATRNIPADYVTSVEIVRNHHSRRVEKDIPSNEVSMNIKLAQKAKFKPFGQQDVGVGAPHLSPQSPPLIPPRGEELRPDGIIPPWGDKRGARLLLGITGMMFTDRFQTISSIKGGNYKDFARADMTDHFGGSSVGTPATSLLGGFGGGAPPQGEYLYQRNGMATINTINKLDTVTTFKVNADYSYHRASHYTSQTSTYMSADGRYITVRESTSPLTKVHMPKLSVNYLKNADRVYLSDEFALKGAFEQNEGDIYANGKYIEQRRKATSFEIANSFYWSDRTPRGTLRYVSSPVSFKRTPSLHLTFGKDGIIYGQSAQSSTLTMNVHSSVSIPIGKTFRLRVPVAFDAIYDDLDVGETLHGWSFTPSLNPGFEIYSRNRRFYFSSGIGAALKGLYFNKMNYTKPVLNPSADMSYTFSANSKLSLYTAYSTQVGDMLSLLTQPLQVDYRTVRTSSGIIGESNTWRTSADWKWQLPMRYFTLRLAAAHIVRQHNTLNSQSIDGIDQSITALQRDTRSHSTDFGISSTKNIPSLYAKFGISGSYSFGDSEQAVNEKIIKVRSNSYNIQGNASITPIPWLELRYDMRYGWSRSRHSDESNTTTSLTHSGAIHIFPIESLDISMNYDHIRRQVSIDTHKHMSLFNASAQYKLRRVVLRLELDNLLNQRTYAYTLFDGINTYSYTYNLCGRTIMMRATFKL